MVARALRQYRWISLLMLVALLFGVLFPAASASTAGTRQTSAKDVMASFQTSKPTELVFATEGEPETLLPKDACSMLSDFVTDNVYDRLTQRSRDGKIVGSLAQSFQQIDPTTWRFNLRRGVTYTNGEPFNADAVVAAVDHYLAPNVSSRCTGNFSTLAWPAKKIDDYTVELKTKEPDPLFPIEITNLYLPAPKWLKTSSQQELSTHAVGTGPYMLAEWKKGQYVLMHRNPDYWGNPKPTIDQIKIVGRPEASVRASTVQTGEADIAYIIPSDLMRQVPRTVVEHTTESVGIRLNCQNPALSDIRVRQAIAYSIDTESLMKSLYPGFSTPLNGQMVRQNAAGQNPDLKPYPFDLDQAKALVKQAGAEGASLDLVIREGNWDKVDELGEAVANMISQTGLKANPKLMNADQWREQLYAVQPGQHQSDMLMTSASDQVFDSSRVLEVYYGTGKFSQCRDTAFQQKVDQAGKLSGTARVKAYQALWAEAQQQYWVIPLFGLDYVHGLSKRVQWAPRDDGHVYFAEMHLAS